MFKKEPRKPVKLKPMKVKSTTDIKRGPDWWTKVKKFIKEAATTRPTQRFDDRL
jgi:hypothetical protein